jgi:3-deoxy-D-manno-octulosonic-acid transferase
MQLFYYVFIRIYRLSIGIASIFNEKARLWVRGRKNIFRQINEKVKSGPVIWVHAASLGEFEQGRPLIEEIRRHYPDYKILVTFFSPSGYEIRKSYQGADYIFYLPLDTHTNAIRFIQAVKPVMALFIKYEFWYYYLSALKSRNIPVYLVSGIFRPQQVFFRWYGTWFRKILENFNHLFVQTKESEAMLRSINITNVTVSGDTRFDRVKQISAQAKEIEIASVFKDGHICLIAGSTWPRDEELLIQYINMNRVVSKFIIVPHEIDETHIRHIIHQLKKPFIRFSSARKAEMTDKQVLIIDNIGMLSSLYRYGDIAYIGGGFGKGIHNILEAAVYGIPVIFGPNYMKFNEANELLKNGGAFSINNFETLQYTLDRLLANNEERNQIGKIAKDYITVNTGATQMIISHIFNK